MLSASDKGGRFNFPLNLVFKPIYIPNPCIYEHFKERPNLAYSNFIELLPVMTVVLKTLSGESGATTKIQDKTWLKVIQLKIDNL